MMLEMTPISYPLCNMPSCGHLIIGRCEKSEMNRIGLAHYEAIGTMKEALSVHCEEI